MRIVGEDVRETTLGDATERDEWTVVTQEDILGDFIVTLEWSLASNPIDELTAAPEVHVPGVTSQRGFVILGGSETLRLTASTTNLAEADLAELPDLPWKRARRVLAVYRYIAPPFSLSVGAEKLQAEPTLDGLVRSARLTSTLAPDGQTFTQAEYVVAGGSESQFLEARLPEGARIWSLHVNDEGVKPSKRPLADGSSLLLVPLPGAAAKENDATVRLIYQETGEPLKLARRLELAGPTLSVPVSRAHWRLNLPPGFEYLALGEDGTAVHATRAPLVTYLRTAHYPDRLVLLGWSTPVIVILSLIACAVIAVVRNPRLLTKKFGVSQPVDEPEKPSVLKRSGCGALVTLLIVLVVIAMLAAIAVPNFLEAQTRAKVSRVQADLRSLATGLEAYHLDNAFNPTEVKTLWQGPVSYLSSGMIDPHTGGEYGSRSEYRYAFGAQAVINAEAAGLVERGRPRTSDFWMAYGLGPDALDDGGRIVYDSTNGTVSRGDIIRISDGGGGGRKSLSRRAGLQLQADTGFAADVDALADIELDGDPNMVSTGPDSRMLRSTRKPISGSADNYFNEESGSQSGDRAGVLLGRGATPEGARSRGSGAFTYDPSNGTSSEGDVWRVKNGGFGGGSMGLSRPSEPRESMPPSVAFEIPASTAPEKAYHAGLLSLGIELPEGGAQHEFETMGDTAQPVIRLMEAKRFQRARFVVWLLAFLAMTAVWFLRRANYRLAFTVAIALTITPPILIQTAWVTFFNAAFQGVLLSLLAPLLAHFVVWLTRRVNHRAVAASLLFIALAAPNALGSEPVKQAAPITLENAREVVARSKAIARAPKLAIRPVGPTRILVPYDNADAPFADEAPQAYMSQDDFARLWNAAHRSKALSTTPSPILAEVSFDGSLDEATASIVGELRVFAVNPTDAPADLSLGLGGITLREWSASSPGALLDSDKGNVRLHMAPRWVGAVSVSLSLPCEILGSKGRMTLSLPEAAAGRLSVAFPYANLHLAGPSAAKCVVEFTDEGAVLRAPIRPAPIDVLWSGSTRAKTTGVTNADTYRADIETHIVWANLSAGKWLTVIDIRPDAAGGVLPGETRFTLDPGVTLLSAAGDSLLSATVTEASELILELAPGDSAQAYLTGVVPPPSRSSGDRFLTWNAPGARAVSATRSNTSLRLEFANEIEVNRVEAPGLERQTFAGRVDGYSVQTYKTDTADWSLTAETRRLRASFDAEINSSLVPVGGFLKRTIALKLSPRAGLLHECAIDVPSGVRVSACVGGEIAGWAQSGDVLHIAFDPPLAGATLIQVHAGVDWTPTDGALSATPVSVRGARDTRRSMTLFVSPDEELIEVDLAGATPRTPTSVDMILVKSLISSQEAESGSLRSYELPALHDRDVTPEARDDAELRFRLSRIGASSFDTVYNLLTISEGLQSLDSVVRSNPRRGRIQTVEALLVLASPDPTAPRRIQTDGPVRHVRTEKVSDNVYRVIAELDAPRAGSVDVRFRLDQSLGAESRDNASSDSLVRAAFLLPTRPAGARALLLLRRAFEGELRPDDLAGSTSLEPTEVTWPKTGDRRFSVRPADYACELLVAPESGPTFAITRHARAKSLKAAIEIMRQRTILTADGLERNELTIVLQNQSEQFLRLALPYPKKDIVLYQTLVAGQVVRPTYVTESDREVLLIPLIRPGLLEPELTVRLAYTALTDRPLRGSGKREQRMPEALGGIPVAQSTLVLMMPSDLEYAKFDGTLRQVELVDLEVDEALREAKTVERLSEFALHSDDAIQEKALDKLSQLTKGIESQVLATKNTYSANTRFLRSKQAGQPAMEREMELQQERGSRLQEAELASVIINSNTIQLKQIVEQRGRVAPKEEAVEQAESTVDTPLIEFPRVGDVFAFRQLQGTGAVTFRYTSREASNRRSDIFWALGLIALTAGLATAWRHLSASMMRLALAVMVLSLAAAIAGIAVDLAIPLLVASFIVVLVRLRASGTAK